MLKLYYTQLSQPSRALLLFLKANKIPFEGKEVNLRAGEHFGDEFKKINPLSKVPVMADGPFILRESVAILRYLCREKNVPDHWYPKESKKQALVDQFLEWQHIECRGPCAMYFRTKFLIPAVTGKPAKEDVVKKNLKRMEDSLDIVENFWLKDHPYLTGNQLSIADILGACEIEQPRMAGYDPTEGRPKIKAWLERISNDLHPHYNEVHEAIYKISKKHGGQVPDSQSKL